MAPGTGTPTSSSIESDALPQNALSEDELQGNHEWFSLESTPDQVPQDADGSADEGDEMARQYWIGHLQDIADTSFLLAPALLPSMPGRMPPTSCRALRLRFARTRADPLPATLHCNCIGLKWRP